VNWKVLLLGLQNVNAAHTVRYFPMRISLNVINPKHLWQSIRLWIGKLCF